MRKILIITLVVLLYSKESVGQVSKDGVLHILNNTSSMRQYLIVFKDSKGTDRIIWSNYMLEYFSNRGYSKKNAIETIARKILKNDTFNIDKTEFQSLCAYANSDTIKSFVLKVKNPITAYINKYFKDEDMKPEYLKYRWEIAKILWDNNAFLFTTSDQISPVPKVLVFKNKSYSYSIAKLKRPKVHGKVRENLPLFFYFPKYDFFIEAMTNDTSCIYNTIRKRTDQEVLNTKRYTGAVECLKINIDREHNSIAITLFDKNEHLLGKEIYHYNNTPTIKEEKIFYNLSGITKVIKRNVIIPIAD